jgi:CRP-like cAMP-binding protein
MEPGADLTAFVARVFACSPATAEAVARRAANRVYAARAVVLRQGDACSDTWLVMAGRAQALVCGVDGQLALVQEYADGDLFGAITALHSGPQAVEKDGRRVVHAPVWTAMAIRIQTTRETVSREISKMERRGQIRREGKSIVLVSPRAIEAEVS